MELNKLSQDARLADRRVFIMTHYAPLLENGKKDSWRHGLENVDTFLLSCAEFEEAVILCGHVHRCYHVIDRTTGEAIFCAGSATLEAKEGFWLFDTRGSAIWATEGLWNGRRYELNEDGAFKIMDQ